MRVTTSTSTAEDDGRSLQLLCPWDQQAESSKLLMILALNMAQHY